MVKVRKDKNNTYTKLLKDKKGISPVITTVILVAVGIALAVAIGLWMSGLVATFTRFEKLEVSSAYAISTQTGWTVTIIAKNTGSADATISTIMINGIPVPNAQNAPGVGQITYSTGNAGPTAFDPDTGAPVAVGSTITFTIPLSNAADQNTIGTTTLSPGITLNIVLHSAAGKDYPASVTLP